MSSAFDPSAVASDVPRSRKQHLARLFARAVVNGLGINSPRLLSTEIVQAIQPVARIATPHGMLYSRSGHGRLVWRAESFHTEEPETVRWLDALTATDVLWDVGANVGLYGIYAAKFRGCKVYSFEPESQNFALLMENIALNDVGDRCLPACLALSDHFAMGELKVRYLTKGGAYNWFAEKNGSAQKPGDDIPDSIRPVVTGEAAAAGPKPVRQLMIGISVDELVAKHGFTAPTHLKIDVDGLEPEIVAGARETLASNRTRSVLIELNKNAKKDMEIPSLLEGMGYRLASNRSNWESRADRRLESVIPTTNMIFTRPS